MDHDFPDFGFKGTTKPTFNSNPILLDPGYDDVFGGPPKYPNSSSPFDFDSMFKDSKNNTKSSSNLPVFDKPLYDHDDGGDIFDGVPGLKTSSSVKFDNSSTSTFDDLLGNLGKKERPEELKSGSLRNKWGEEDNNTAAAFDDLLPGFGATSPPTNRVIPGTTQPQQSSVASSISTSSVVENPFVVLEPASVPAYASSRLFAESLEQIDKTSQSGSRKVEVSSVQGEIFDTDPIVNMAKSKPIFPSGADNKEKDGIGLGTSAYGTHTSTIREPSGEPSKFSENASQRKVSIDNFQKSHQSRFSMPTVSSDSHHAFTQNGPHANSSSETNSDTGMSPKSDDNLEAADDVWLTVSEITLTTLPTRVPPPSRPAPPRPQQNSREAKDFSSANIKKPDAFSSFYPPSQSYGRPQTVPDAVKNPGFFSSNDEFADFSMARPQGDVDERGDVTSNVEDTENSSAAASAAAMKEAVDRAEAKFKHAREVRERENAAKNSGVQQEREEKVLQDFKERDQERLDREQEQRERDEKDREQRRIEKEREQAREIERQRETGRQAVDRATKEVRERAAAEARQKAQRAAVDKVNAGARERAERAAVQRAQAEARERAAKEARLRAEKAAAEAKERKNAEENEKTAAAASAEAEARIRAGRASVNRATAEARERAAAAASAAAAATRGNQQKNENDLDSFFNTSARPDSASRPRTSSSDSTFDAQFQDRPGTEGIQRSSTATTSGVRKASSTTNISDDLTSFFGSTTSSGDFQEIGGESDERRRARLERNQRTQERAEKALAEKNERDRHTQWEQAERGRIAESLDFEIKRWSAGKEGNLRALLSTLQYVLWPECGWQPVSLTDLITSASVKKVYRKATLCIHPDKVQQKGANLQQKYIAEKVFDMLKEAWNKLNSEELF